jgi:glycine dehydrogenase subunit 1
MPYILNTDNDRQEMLKAVGVSSLAELFSQLPKDIRLKEKIDLPNGLTESEVKKSLQALAAHNHNINEVNSFLGAGCYDHYIPAALPAIMSRSEFVTAYTPYQPEASQGILQAIYEYQSYICLLTGMDAANASMFDGASALAEGVLVAIRVSGRSKIIVAGAIHPEYREVLETYLGGFDFKIKEIGFNDKGLIDFQQLKSVVDDKTACLVFQSPNFLGMIEDVKMLKEIAVSRGALLVMSTNPMSLSLLKAPGELGVDIVCGDGQPLGGSLNMGGPSFGFFAVKNEHLRQMPGRIVGRTLDKDNRMAYCLTMQAREQHIRREKATSNICSNQSLNAISAAVYLSLMGKEGFKAAGLKSLNMAQYFYQRLKEIKLVKVCSNSSFFNEFSWEVDGAKKIIDKLYKKEIIAGFWLGKFNPKMKNSILSCCTEKKSKQDVDSFIEELKKII